MAKISGRPSSPNMRRLTPRKAIAENRFHERQKQIQTDAVKENIKNQALAKLQEKQRSLRENDDLGEAVSRKPRSTFLRRDNAVDFRDARQERLLSSLSPNLYVMIQAVQKAGRELVHDFGELEKLQVSQKGAADFASDADMASERILREYLQKARPGYGFLQEEGGEIAGTDTSHRWIVDPLDGTMNFLHAIPHFSISLALQQDKEIIAGVVYNPVSNDLFYAEKGFGAWAMTQSGSVRIRVSNRTKLNESLVVTGVPHLGHGFPDRFIRQLTPFMTRAGGVRRMGSAALDLAYVAAGRFDCYWEEDIKLWDIAAGMLLVREAGGRLCTVNGEEDTAKLMTAGSIVATNALQYEVFKKMISDASKSVVS